jgi:hypothetical protein
MNRSIKISESQLKKIVDTLSESLGVPEGILETAEDLYDVFMEELVANYDSPETNGYQVEIDMEFNISDLKVKKSMVMVDVTIDKDLSEDNYYILGYSTPFKSGRSKDASGRLKILSNFNAIVIIIKVVVPDNFKFEKLVDLLEKNKDEIVNSFSHELMHVYRNYKTGYDYAEERAHYTAVQKISFGVKPLDEFLHFMYFITAIENVVRPTEIAMAIKQGDIDQKRFLEFLKNNETYMMLDKIRKFSYEDLKKNLEKYIPQIDEVGQIMNYNMGSTNEEKINEILRLVYINLINIQGEEFLRLMTSELIEQLLGLQGEKNKKFKKYIRKIQKFKTPDEFFENQEKIFKFVANEMIKKISKVYAMTKKEDSSIKEWDLYHKVNNTSKNLQTEIKFKVK